MRKIKIFDTTLRDGEQSPGCTMTINEKIELAKRLDALGVDVIEAGFAASSEKDFEAIKEISKAVWSSTVTALARCNKNDIDLAYEAIKNARNKRIHTFIATSDIHMRDKLHKTKEQVKQMVKEMVSYAKSKCEDIEFSLEDATRTNKDFAVEIIDIAIESGATTINVPDTVGYTVPEEFIEFITYLKKHSKHLNNVDLSVHCHNDLGLAVANSLAALKAGATQIECTINGIGERAGNAALEEIVACIDIKKDYFDAMTNIYKKEIYDTSKYVQDITGSKVQNNKPIVGRNAFLHESGIHQAGVINNKETYEILVPQDYGIEVNGIVIGSHSGKNAIINKMEELGFDIERYNVDNVVSDIKKFTADKSEITDKVFINIVEQNRQKVLVRK